MNRNPSARMQPSPPRPSMPIEKGLLNAATHVAEVRRQIPPQHLTSFRRTVSWWLQTTPDLRWSACSGRPTVDPLVAWWMQHLSGAIIPIAQDVGLSNYRPMCQQLADWLTKQATRPAND